MNGNALGLIETQGLVGLINAVDAMLKAASVELASSIIKLDGGLVSVMVRGDVSSVRAAVEAGAEAAGRVGELKAAHVIPRPGDAVVRAFGGGSAPLKILVANLGSTSFKYRLYDLDDPAEHAARARGRSSGSARTTPRSRSSSPRGEVELVEPIADHGDAVQICLDQLTDPEIGVLERRRRGRGDRLQGGPRPEPDRRPAGRRGRARGDGGVRRRRPRAQSALRQGDADARASASPSCRWSPRSRPASTARSPRPTSATRSPRTGRPSSASAAGGSTARAIATSPAGWPSCSAATTSR